LDLAYTQTIFNQLNVRQVLKEYGSPLYVYDERILRERCREMKAMMSYPGFKVVYSAKANTNVELLKIIRSEGLMADAMSPGEIYLESLAGFTGDEIMFVTNNVSEEEFKNAVSRGIYCSVDSMSQLATLGNVNRGGEVCLRINTDVGAGHHEKVVTGGKKAKFGIAKEDLAEALSIASRYDMRVTGLNSHIGSLFLDGQAYLQAAQVLLALAKQVPDLRLLDFGGGFGISYDHSAGVRLDLTDLGKKLEAMITQWVEETGKPITAIVEPGRYVTAECGVILGWVTSVKNNYNTWFVGCDVGFHTLLRPAMYGSYHEISIAPHNERAYQQYEQAAYLVGPICENGDILVKDRPLPVCEVGDGLIVHDTGAYGFVMASVYNSRPLPAELLLRLDGTLEVIRPAKKIEDLWHHGK
jgi:diaminopimelate decarboxylase